MCSPARNAVYEIVNAGTVNRLDEPAQQSIRGSDGFPVLNITFEARCFYNLPARRNKMRNPYKI